MFQILGFLGQILLSMWRALQYKTYIIIENKNLHNFFKVIQVTQQINEFLNLVLHDFNKETRIIRVLSIKYERVHPHFVD